MKPPAAVKTAIEQVCLPEVFSLRPPAEGESSVIFDWGVRVEYVEDGRKHLVWICLADAACRQARTVLILSGGKTSSATKHLRMHHDVISEKTSVEQLTKRKRDDEIEYLQSSALFRNNPRRLALLLETTRIVNNNLALSFGESKESRLIEAMLKKPEVQTTVNAARVSRSVIELYASARRNIASFLEGSRTARIGNFSLMTDFWTCTITHKKYIGVRVYLVDANFEFKSVLLGVRKFEPMFGDRDKGIAGPFRASLVHLLEDFGLQLSDFFGATSDGGAEVKKMLASRLGLQREWCIAHMAHAATKAACGMNDGASQNPELTALLGRVTKTIAQVKTVEKLGNLFTSLCETMSEGASTQLLDYAAHRFLSLTKSIRRILEKWIALKAWYEARAEQAVRQKKAPPSFPLEHDHETLVQLLSLLQPIHEIKAMSQAESAIQVEVLLALYRVRLNTLRLDTPLKDFRSTKQNPLWIAAASLTPLIVKTRELLRNALNERFFARYFVPEKRLTCPFVFEMQQRLHPVFKTPDKSLNRIVRLTCRDNGASVTEAHRVAVQVATLVHTKIRDLMLSIADPQCEEQEGTKDDSHSQGLVDELVEEFGSRRRPRTTADRVAAVVDDELHRWTNDEHALRSIGDRPERILEFWKRMQDTGEFRILPKLARFSMQCQHPLHKLSETSVCVAK